MVTTATAPSRGLAPVRPRASPTARVGSATSQLLDNSSSTLSSTSTSKCATNCNNNNKDQSQNHSQFTSPPVFIASESRAGRTEDTESRVRVARRPSRARPLDSLSDCATELLIRRVLCSQQHGDEGRRTPQPIEDLLPPLTSRSDVDLQLYVIIAIILREYVQNWYNKITPDQSFVTDIVQIIAHCTRLLEQRLRKVDLESLLLDELPELLDRHISAHRAAHSVMVPLIQLDPREIYHSLCPLPALSPVPKKDNALSTAEQAENEAAYRHLLIEAALAVLLPTEDLGNECLTSLVSQILSELIIGNVVAKKAAEPWLIWEALCILARVIQQRRPQEPVISERDGASGEGDNTQPVRPGSTHYVTSIFWAVVQWCFLVATFFRLLFITATLALSLPSRLRNNHRSAPSQKTLVMSISDQKHPVLAYRIWPTISNLIELNARMPWLWGVLALIQWILVAGIRQLAGLDGAADRFLSHTFHTLVLDPAQVAPRLRSIRAALFPNNQPGKPGLQPPANEQELLALRRRCAAALYSLMPRTVAKLYFGSPRAGLNSLFHDSREPLSGQEDIGPHPHPRLRATTLDLTAVSPSSPAPNQPPAQSHQPLELEINQSQDAEPGRPDMTNPTTDTNRIADLHDPKDEEDMILSAIETSILDIFGDAYCNKHLMYSILELVLVRLMPELAEKSVGELWAERMG